MKIEAALLLGIFGDDDEQESIKFSSLIIFDFLIGIEDQRMDSKQVTRGLCQ